MIVTKGRPMARPDATKPPLPAFHYPTCERNIIERDGVPVGRLWIDEWRDQIRLVDIALVPDCRGVGIGSTLLRQVMDRGAAAGKPVTIHVEGFNPALRLYHSGSGSSTPIPTASTSSCAGRRLR